MQVYFIWSLKADTAHNNRTNGEVEYWIYVVIFWEFLSIA